MKTRIITGVILAAVLVGVLLSGFKVICAAVAAISVLGLFEFYKATGLLAHKGLCALGYVAGAAICLRFFIPVDFLLVMLYAFMLTLFCIMLKSHKTVSVTEGAMVIFSLVYIPFFLSTLVDICIAENGNYYLWLVFVGAILTDTCAYFSGVFLGKHKLCPEISPKKTIEGSVGGTLGCVIFVMLFGLLLDKKFGLQVNYVAFGVLGVLIAVVSQIGDLTASIIKRKYGVKDYGSLFPGHGGILDRLDSIIAVSPLVYLFVKFFG